MIIIDAHQDIAYNALCFNRDYTRSALKKRQLEYGTPVPPKAGIATCGLPEALVGRIALIFSTLFVAPRTRQSAPWDNVMYATPQEAYKLARTQLDYYERLAENDKITLIKTQTDLDAVLQTWEADTSLKSRVQGLVLLMENADPIVEPAQLEEWYELGLRIVGPAWQASRYCGGTGQPGNLTTLGHDLLETMSDFNMILDLSHMAEEAYFEALNIYEGPIIASHSNPRKFVDTDRHLSDEIIRSLAERDGVMGIVLYNRFLDQTWTPTDKKDGITVDRIVAAIDHVCQVTGSALHVGIGTDFDGGFGTEAIPYELDTVADLYQIGDALSRFGYAEEDIVSVMGGNMLRKLREGLPE
ncbi:MAG: membrane dipeptidase [Aggregatilineales bacterium]